MKKTLNTKNYKLQTSGGFTLVEVMISVGLFVTVMLVGVGAVLNTNVTHKRTLAVRQVLDSVNFLVEDMARNIRLGYNYRCGIEEEYEPSSGNYTVGLTIEIPRDCEEGFSVAFEAQGGSPGIGNDQMAYIIESNSFDSANIKKIATVKDYGSVASQTIIRDVTPALGQTQAVLTIDPRQSGFTVIGSDPYPDTAQPRVIIRLSGYVDYKNNRVPFSIQTTVSQRLIDS